MMKRQLLIIPLSSIIFSLVSCSIANNNSVEDLVPLPEGYTGRIIDDLEDGDRFNYFQGTWFIYDDRYSEGNSSTVPTAYSEFIPENGGPLGSTKYANFRGKVTSKIPDGYVGIGMDLNPNNNQSRNLSEYDAIEFWSKGDGKLYHLKIHSKATPDYDDYGYKFQTSSEWQRHIIPFSSLTQEGFKNPTSLEEALSTALKIQWQTVGQPHDSVDLAIDNIRLLKTK